MHLIVERTKCIIPVDSFSLLWNRIRCLCPCHALVVWYNTNRNNNSIALAVGVLLPSQTHFHSITPTHICKRIPTAAIIFHFENGREYFFTQAITNETMWEYRNVIKEAKEEHDIDSGRKGAYSNRKWVMPKIMFSDNESHSEWKRQI